MKYYWYGQQSSATIIGEGEVNDYRAKRHDAGLFQGICQNPYVACE